MKALSRATSVIVKDWSAELLLGLPKHFDFRVIRTGDDIVRLFLSLPDQDRGFAAKCIYEKRNLLGNEIAYGAMMKAWDHDHQWVRKAFGGDRPFTEALSRVSPPSKRKRRIRIWRGVKRVDDALGLSWTTDRDLACWFALRFFDKYQTAFVFTCLVSPDEIVTEYNGRGEREVIPNANALVDRVFLDEGNDQRTIKLTETLSKDDVSPSTIANWRRGFDRTKARRRAELEAMRRAARKKLKRR